METDRREDHHPRRMATLEAEQHHDNEQATKELLHQAQQAQDGGDRMPKGTEVQALLVGINTDNPHRLRHGRNRMDTLPDPNQTRQKGRNHGHVPTAMAPSDGQRRRKRRGRERLQGREQKNFKSAATRRRGRSRKKSGGRPQRLAKWNGRRS
jgi:nanoRNase/pAp phosphatase (c-di-AMP/oligoRNAs hydrolase)